MKLNRQKYTPIIDVESFSYKEILILKNSIDTNLFYLEQQLLFEGTKGINKPYLENMKSDMLEVKEKLNLIILNKKSI